MSNTTYAGCWVAMYCLLHSLVEEQPPANGNVAGRPATGPAAPFDQRGKRRPTLGRCKPSNCGNPDPLASPVLNRGEAIVAPRGRADDVSLPRPDVSGAAIPPPCAIPPEIQTPRAIQKKGIRTISKLGTDAKNHPTHITRGRFPSQLCTALELQRIAGAVRRNRSRNTTARAALCTRKTFPAKSKPIVLTSHGRLRLADSNGPPCHIDAVAEASAPPPPLKANRTSRSLAKSLTHRQGEG